MAAFNFPNSPSVNDTHTENGVSWKWNGTVWKRTGSAYTDTTNLNVTGIGTFAGAVNIAGVLTYEDVKNVDSVGIITARTGLSVTAGDVVIPDKIVHAGDTNTAIRFPTADTVSVETAGTERLRIDSDGKIFVANEADTIDTTARLGEGNRFQLSGLSSNDGISVVRYSASYGAWGLNLGRSKNNTLGTNTSLGDNDDIGHITFWGADGSDFNKAAQISAEVDGSPSDGTDMPGALVFKTSAEASGTPTERVRITSDGKISIGEDDPDGNYLLIRAASTVGTKNGHIMLTGDSATNGQGPQIVFSESGGGSNFAGAYIGHVRTTTNSVGDLVFGTRATGGDANTIPTERLRINSSGNVGIGTDNPQCLLDMSKDISGGVNYVDIRNHHATGGAALRVKTQGTYGSPLYQAILGASDAGATIRVGAVTNHPLIVLQNNTERYRITTAGTNVFGGNTSAPIVDNGELYYRGNSTQTFESLPQSFYLYGTTLGSGTANAGTGMVFGGNYNTSNAYTTFAGIHGIKENTTSGQYGGALVFGVRNDGGGAWERMRLKSNGDLSITDGNLKVASGHGIDFSSTADGSGGGMWGELLDDYEHGSFTPTTNGWSTATPYSGSNYNSGWYVKVGDIVHVGWKIYYNTLSGSGNHIGIGGFPFSSAGNQTSIAAARFDVPETAVTYDLIFYMGSNATSVWLYRKNSSGSISAINSSGNRSNVWTMGQVTYYSG